MARSRIPDPLKRRHLVDGSPSKAQALATAEAYLEEGRDIEALDFLALAGALERVAELRRQAVEQGDAFLLRAAARAAGESPTPVEWVDLMAAAEAAGKEYYAADARRQAERTEE